ncbi:hypothetical protein CH340_14740 [Rhodoplanes serenus]|nr:hypothetical protein CH340_14740 [Rhodoplanes serenus]
MRGAGLRSVAPAGVGWPTGGRPLGGRPLGGTSLGGAPTGHAALARKTLARTSLDHRARHRRAGSRSGDDGRIAPLHGPGSTPSALTPARVSAADVRHLAPAHARPGAAGAQQGARMESTLHDLAPASVRRPPTTRERLLRAALTVFAEHGYAGASVRRICQRARTNPAAVKHYFGNKEGLYHEVLGLAAAAFAGEGDAPMADDDRSPEAMLRDMIRHQLRPVLRRNTIGRCLRVFAWEDLAPSRPYKQFLASGRSPVLATAATIARRVLPPEASQEEIAVATVWLMNQAMPFVRSREALGGAPFGLRFDAAAVDRIAERLTRLALAGLPGAARRLD